MTTRVGFQRGQNYVTPAFLPDIVTDRSSLKEAAGSQVIVLESKGAVAAFNTNKAVGRTPFHILKTS